MSTKTKQNSGLSTEAQAFFDRVQKEWSIVDGTGTLTLMVACQALDRLRQAQAILAKEGVIATDRFGQPRIHPAAQIEKEARNGLLTALRALNLDLASLDIEGGGDGKEA
jgi:phage terminase small subunit